jgi:hypothetical protein
LGGNAEASNKIVRSLICEEALVREGLRGGEMGGGKFWSVEGSEVNAGMD